MASLALFQWLVPKAGYRWVVARPRDIHQTRQSVRLHAGRRGREWMMVRADAGDSSPWVVRTLPLRDSPALFRTFAELDPGDPEAVLSFANSHGWLGLNSGESWPGQMVSAPTEDTPGRVIAAEGLAEWAEAIYSVRQVTELLDAAERNDVKTLSRWITAQEGFAVYRRYDSSMPTRETYRRMCRKDGKPPDTKILQELRPAALTFPIEGGDSLDGGRTPLAEYVNEGELTQAARFFAQRIINRGLNEHTRAACVWNPDTRQHGLHVVPRNLLGALWVQASGLAEGGRDYERCETCRGWFVLAPDINRADRRYCSDRCRHKAYRERMRRARQLRDAGLSPSAIARELHSDTDTVRRWLAMRTQGKKATS